MILQNKAIIRPPVQGSVSQVYPQGATNQRTGVFYSGNNGPRNAVAAAIGGDTILVNPNTYNLNIAGNDSNGIRIYVDLTVKSAVPGVRPIFDMGNVPFNMFYCGLPFSQTTFEWIEFTGNQRPGFEGGGGAALYGVNNTSNIYILTLKNCYFHGCGNGMLMPHLDHGGVFILENNIFHDNGAGGGQHHAIYISGGASLTMRGNWLQDTRSRYDGYDPLYIGEGNLVKTRTPVTIIEGNRITMGKGESNRCIDLPNGGDCTIRGNLIEMIRSRNSSGGGQAMSFGVEEGTNFHAGYTTHKLRFEQNTVVNHPGQFTGSADDLQVLNQRYWMLIITIGAQAIPPPSLWNVKDNVFAGFDSVLVQTTNPNSQGGTGTAFGAEGNVYEPSFVDNTVITKANLNAAMPNHADLDFTLATPILGSQHWAPWSYAHTAAYTARIDDYRGGVPGP